MDSVTLIGFYSHAHPADISENRIKNAVGVLKNKGIKVNFIGCVADHDDDKVEITRKKLIESIGDSCCIILAYSGWSESTGILNIISNYLHLPIIIWSLAGYKSNSGIIATAAAAGASLLRSSLDNMKVKYRCVYDTLDSTSNLEEVLGFIHIFKLLRQFWFTKILSIGYACSNLYPFMYDGSLIKTTTGIHVDNLELLELKMLAEEITEDRIKIFRDDFNKRYNMYGRLPVKEINLLAGYYIAANDIIEKNNYKGISVKCASGPGRLLGFTPCMLLSMLGDKINAICEGDIYGLLSMTIVNMLTGLRPTFLEVFEFYKDSVLMASCGFAPFSLCKQDCIKIYEHDWDGCGGLMNISSLKTGDITLFNIHNTGGKLKMQVFTGIGNTPENFQEEGWREHNGPIIPALRIEFDSGIESFRENIKGPHYIMLHGKHMDIIKDYCEFAGIEIDFFK